MIYMFFFGIHAFYYISTCLSMDALPAYTWFQILEGLVLQALRVPIVGVLASEWRHTNSSTSP